MARATPTPPPSPYPAPSPRPQSPDLRLDAIVSISGEPDRAMLTAPSGHSRVVSPGDSIGLEDATLLHIDEGGVALLVNRLGHEQIVQKSLESSPGV